MIRPLPAAGALWLVAGLTYLTAETTAALSFPHYRYGTHYISDLGVPGLSPRAALMNLGFIIDGTLYGIAAIMAARAWRGAHWFLAAALAHAAGTVIVGTIHAGPDTAPEGTLPWHVLGAAMAIVGGNLASLLAPGPTAMRKTARLLGCIGLASLAAFEANRLLGAQNLPDGLLERGAVYTITIWEIVTGVALLAGRSRMRI